MTIQPEHRALIFIGAIAILGAGVRVARAVGSRRPAEAQPALEQQMQAADSAAKAAQRRKAMRGQGSSNAGRVSVGPGDTGSAVRSRRSASRSPTRSGGRDSARADAAAALDRAGYIGGKLDLDVATAAQVDSLPGISPGMARRIVADRMRRGPFLNADGLRRIAGVGPRFLAQIASLVTFSGTFVPGSPSDSVIPPRSPARRSPRPIRPPP